MRIEGFAGVKVMVVNAGGGGSTVRAAGELVTPEDDAVTCAAPATMPVAIPPWTVAMTLLEEAHVKVSPVMGLLYWSIPVAVKVCLLPTRMDADAGATLIFVNTEGARTTVGGGVTMSRVDVLRPLAAAVMLVVPAVSPAANPDVFTVATVGRLLVKVKEALIACPCWFSSVALNCCVAPA